MFDTGRRAPAVCRRLGLPRSAMRRRWRPRSAVSWNTTHGESRSTGPARISVLDWLMGQVMRETRGKANPRSFATCCGKPCVKVITRSSGRKSPHLSGNEAPRTLAMLATQGPLKLMVASLQPLSPGPGPVDCQCAIVDMRVESVALLMIQTYQSPARGEPTPTRWL